LFGHAMNFVSVTFWDHSIASFLLLLGAIGAIQSEAEAQSSLPTPPLFHSFLGSTAAGGSVQR